MRLQPGTAAPDFTASTAEGKTITLSSLRGRPVWLAFHRYSSCPLCNSNISALIGAWPSLQERIAVLAVFQSPPESVRRYVGKQAPPFPLLCDPEEKLYALYNVEHSVAGYVTPANIPGLMSAFRRGFMPGKMEGTKTRLPADFLIGASGVIQVAHYSGRIGEHLSVDAVDAFLGKSLEPAS